MAIGDDDTYQEEVYDDDNEEYYEEWYDDDYEWDDDDWHDWKRDQEERECVTSRLTVHVVQLTCSVYLTSL